MFLCSSSPSPGIHASLTQAVGGREVWKPLGNGNRTNESRSAGSPHCPVYTGRCGRVAPFVKRGKAGKPSEVPVGFVGAPPENGPISAWGRCRRFPPGAKGGLASIEIRAGRRPLPWDQPVQTVRTRQGKPWRTLHRANRDIERGCRTGCPWGEVGDRARGNPTLGHRPTGLRIAARPTSGRIGP